jgi:hypothetical protein
MKGESVRDEIGDGAKRVRLFGARSGRFTVAEAANLAGIAYSTAYYWHRHGIFSPTGDLGERFEHPAQRCYSARDVLILAVLREARSRCSVTDKRGRRTRWLRRVARALVEQGDRKLTSREPYLRAVLFATDTAAEVFNGNMPFCRMAELVTCSPKSAVLIDLHQVNAELPNAVRE